MQPSFRVGTLLLFTVILANCSKSQPVRRVWPESPRGGQSTPPPEFADIGTMDGQVLQVGEERLTRADSRLLTARVEGAFTISVRDGAGKLRYAETQGAIELTPQLKSKIQYFEERKQTALDHLKKIITRLAGSPRVFGPELIIEQGSGASQQGGVHRKIVSGVNSRSPEIYWRVEFLDPAEDRFWRVRANALGEVESLDLVGSKFVEGQGVVFPEGPKKSALTRVPLPALVGDGTLTTATLKTSSATDSGAWDALNQFQYPLEDYRFDQVQAFYYVDRATREFSKVFGFQLPFSLDVKVHVGGLEKPGNSAFYYRGFIRLGAGDGETYQHIARDPSIVTHETAHAFIDAVTGLPFEGQGGSINEALADFLTANFLDNPNLGEFAYLKAPFKRTLLNTFKTSDFSDRLYADSLVLSGTLWEIRQKLGAKTATRFVVKLMARLTPKSDLSEIRSLTEYVMMKSGTSDDFTDAEIAAIRGVMESRGWKE